MFVLTEQIVYRHKSDQTADTIAAKETLARPNTLGAGYLTGSSLPSVS